MSNGNPPEDLAEADRPAADAHAPTATDESVLLADRVGEPVADASADGQWVWQYAAPAPPPSFGARFFSGRALPELYRFFACGLLVVLGCLLPWGPTPSGVEGGAPFLPVPDSAGYETTAGAASLVIGLWLVFSACYGIATGRQKILPVFLMLEPTAVSWLRLLDAHGAMGTESGILALLDAAGTGVLLTLVGSSVVTLQFVLVMAKVYTKKDDKGAARKGRKDGSPATGIAAPADGAPAASADDAPSASGGRRGRRR